MCPGPNSRCKDAAVCWYEWVVLQPRAMAGIGFVCRVGRYPEDGSIQNGRYEKRDPNDSAH